MNSHGRRDMEVVVDPVGHHEWISIDNKPPESDGYDFSIADLAFEPIVEVLDFASTVLPHDDYVVLERALLDGPTDRQIRVEFQNYLRAIGVSLDDNAVREYVDAVLERVVKALEIANAVAETEARHINIVDEG